MKKAKHGNFRVIKRDDHFLTVFLLGLLAVHFMMLGCLVYLLISNLATPISAVYENIDTGCYYVEVKRKTSDGVKIYGGWLPLLESEEEGKQVLANGPQFPVQNP